MSVEIIATFVAEGYKCRLRADRYIEIARNPEVPFETIHLPVEFPLTEDAARGYVEGWDLARSEPLMRGDEQIGHRTKDGRVVRY